MDLAESPTLSPREVILRYGLRPHPEGGHFREVYRSARRLSALPGDSRERAAVTAIYFLLSGGEFSAFHRVRSDELWIHLAGAPLELVLLEKGPRSHRLAPAGGKDTPLVAVPAGVLQAARSFGEWTLVTCVVAPGFDFADFEMPSQEDLLKIYPTHSDLIRRFTRYSPVPR